MHVKSNKPYSTDDPRQCRVTGNDTSPRLHLRCVARSFDIPSRNQAVAARGRIATLVGFGEAACLDSIDPQETPETHVQNTKGRLLKASGESPSYGKCDSRDLKKMVCRSCM